jgi:GT2 family glycosyltransferase
MVDGRQGAASGGGVALRAAHSLGVSIVLYKAAIPEIAPLLTALQNQGAAKIFVVDNSPPGFAGKNDLREFPAVTYEATGRNLGYGRAHNIAIRRSAGVYKYHLICNPDIALSEGVIGGMIAYMDQNPDVGLCMPKLVGTDGQMQYCCRRSPVVLDYLSQIVLPGSWGNRRRQLLEMRSCDYDKEMEVECLSGCFMLFRSDVLLRLGGFDERFFLYFEDFDLSVRSQSLARNVYIPFTHVVHGRQSQHKKSWRLKLVFASSAFRYFSKWGWFSRDGRAKS